MKLSKTAKLTASMLLFLLFAPYLPADAGPPMPKSESRLKKRSPQEVANAYYNKGISFRDSAWEYEKKLTEATSESAKEKLNQKAQKAYAKAIKQFNMALKKNPNMHQAHSSLGYALRKTGNFQSSLESYNKALEIAPTYTEAIEYRAEAHLGLNMLDHAKEAYMVLFKHDRPRADKLLAAMRDWVIEKNANAGNIKAETIQSFGSWVKERHSIAQKTGTKGSNSVW